MVVPVAPIPPWSLRANFPSPKPPGHPPPIRCRLLFLASTHTRTISSELLGGVVEILANSSRRNHPVRCCWQSGTGYMQAPSTGILSASEMWRDLAIRFLCEASGCTGIHERRQIILERGSYLEVHKPDGGVAIFVEDLVYSEPKTDVRLTDLSTPGEGLRTEVKGDLFARLMDTRPEPAHGAARPGRNDQSGPSACRPGRA